MARISKRDISLSLAAAVFMSAVLAAMAFAAGLGISSWTSQTDVLSSSDLVGVTDVSDPSGSTSGTSKQATIAQLDTYHNNRKITSADGIILQTGDAAGTYEVTFEDSGSTEVASIDSDGNADFSGDLAAASITATTTSGAVELEAVTTDTENALITANAPAGEYRIFGMESSGSTRWRFETNADSETGASAGSDFNINRYDDAGSWVATPFEIERSSGNITLRLDSGDLLIDDNNVINSNQNVHIRTGDLSGAYEVQIQDSGGSEVASIDSDGNAYFSGALQGYTQVTNKTGDATLTDAEMNGIVFVNPSATATMTLPAVEVGQTVCVYAQDSNELRVDPNASDRINLGGTAATDGEYITTSSGSGAYICLIGDSSEGWTTLGSSGTWTEETP